MYPQFPGLYTSFSSLTNGKEAICTMRTPKQQDYIPTNYTFIVQLIQYATIVYIMVHGQLPW